MSSSEMSREVAWRAFASEYDDATLSFKEGEDERAPNYVVTPTGAKVNRLFVVGVLTETENVGNDGDMYRARISDPTGAFVSYAGQYQQEAMSYFADADPPMFVALVGKARTYEPDDADAIYTSVRPEEVNGVDGATRDRWNVQTARQTLARIDAVTSYFRGTVESDGANALLARLHDLEATADHYDLDAAYLTDLRRQCLEVLGDVAGEEIDEDAARVDLDPAATARPSDAGEEVPSASERATDEPAASDEDGADDETSDFDPAAFDDVDHEPVGSSTDDGDADVVAGAGSGAAGDAVDDGDVGDSEDGAGPPDGETEAAGDSEDGAGPTDGETEAASDGTAEAETETGATEDPAEAPDEETAAPDDAGDRPADVGGVDQEGEWEWDEGERERLEEEFGADFESAADIGAGEGGTEDIEAGEGGTEDIGVGEGDTEDIGVGEGGTEDIGVGEGGTEDIGAGEGGMDDTGPGERATDDAEAEEAATADSAADESGTAAEESAADVLMAVLEDADPEGLGREDAVAEAVDRGLDEDTATEALDELLMDGLCYESGDVIKPL